MTNSQCDHRVLNDNERYLLQQLMGKAEKIRLASFNILTADGQEHTLTIEPDNIFYDGDLDIIHQWLVKRGFVINKSLAAKKTFPLIPSGIFLISATTVLL